MPETMETRPLPNEHSARVKDPSLFKDGDGNWGSKNIATGIRIILGILKSTNKWETQAYRFKSDKFTVEEAKKWLKGHDIKYISFEPAIGENKESLPDDCERRIFSPQDAELRVADDGKSLITGYAAKYGMFTDLGFFREKIKEGAFNEALADKDMDVRCLKNHDPNLILGRTKNGTLRINTNTVGLKFDNDMPDTTTGRDTLEEIRRGDISGCSFAFTVKEDDWRHYEDKISERTIIKISKLYDVSPCTYPAYPDTTVAARSLDNFKMNHKPEEKVVDTEIATNVVVDTEIRKEEPQKTIEEKKLELERQQECERLLRKGGRIFNRIKEKLENKTQ